MISDERQRRLFALWFSLPPEVFVTWMGQQDDQEELRRLIAHMERVDNQHNVLLQR